MVVVDNTIVNVALPTLSEDLDASITELQWVVDAYTLVFAALCWPSGTSATASAANSPCSSASWCSQPRRPSPPSPPPRSSSWAPAPSWASAPP